MKDWTRERIIPISATAIFLVVGVNFGVEWNPLHGNPGFAGALDIWRSYAVTNQMLHGHLSQVYARSSGLVGLPGALVILGPGVALSQLLHLSVGEPLTLILAPTAWVVMEPWVLILCSPFLFAVDATARRLDVSFTRRWWLAALEIVVLWNVAVWYGHPEYPLSVACLLVAVSDATDRRWTRCGWMFGLAIALQPIALPVVGVAFAFTPARRWLGLVVKMIVPPFVVLIGPLVANFHLTIQTLHEQPASLTRDHVTPWVHLAPRLPGPWVSAAPFRTVGTLVAFALCVALCRRRPPFDVVVWIVAAVLVVRCLVDPVLVSYYVFPALAVALLAAAPSGRHRFSAVGVLAILVTLLAKAGPGGEWRWFLLVVGGTVAAVVAAWPHGGSGTRISGQSGVASRTDGRRSTTAP